MKTKENIAKWLKFLLGLFLIIYALNQFFHFIPTSYGEMPEKTRNFLDSIVFYLPLLYIFEIITGLLLIFNKWSSLILIVIFPLSVAFLMFSFINNDFGKMLPALTVAVINIILLIIDKEKYKPLFTN